MPILFFFGSGKNRIDSEAKKLTSFYKTTPLRVEVVLDSTIHNELWNDYFLIGEGVQQLHQSFASLGRKDRVVTAEDPLVKWRLLWCPCHRTNGN